MFHLRRLMSFTAAIVSTLSAVAQKPNTPVKASEDSIVHLISANKALQVEEDGVTYRRVTGDAKFLHNDTYLLCDSASWNINENIIEAYGNVRLMQDQTMLTSDELIYLIDEDLARFRGVLVELQDKDGNRLRTRQLDYNTKDSVAFFKDGGAMKSKDGDVVEGRHGTYDSKIKTFTFDSDVKVFMDSLLMATEQLTYLSDSSKTYFGRNTYTWQDDVFIRSDDGWYSKDDSTVCFKSNVYCNDPTYEAWAEEAYRIGPTREVELIRDVRILNEGRSTALFGNRIRYIRDSTKAYVLENPAAAYFGQNEKGESDCDTLFVAADTMIFRAVPRYEFQQEEIDAAAKRREDALFDALAEFRAKQAEENARRIEEGLRSLGKLPPLDSTKAGGDDENARQPAESPSPIEDLFSEPDSSSVNCIWAFHNVKLFRGDLQAMADSVTFTTLDSIAVMNGRPVMWNQVKNQLTGETMHLLIKDGNVDRGSMLTDARITTREDENHFNQIKSAEMMGFFKDNELYRYDALGSVAAIFYMREEDRLTNINIKESKSLTAMIKDATATRMLYLEEIKSDAYPIPDIEEEKRKFKGFEWRGDERPETRFDVTEMTVPESARESFSETEKPDFNETDEYFGNYMSEVYRQLSRREERRKWEKIEKQLDRDAREVESLAYRQDMAELDSLCAAYDSALLAMADSLYKIDIPESPKLNAFPNDTKVIDSSKDVAPDKPATVKKSWWKRLSERRAARRAARVARKSNPAA